MCVCVCACVCVCSDEWTEFIENVYTVTGGYSQQVCKIPKRLIANYAGIAKFKTACQKIQYQRKNLLITYVFLPLIFLPMTKKLPCPLMPARLIYRSSLGKIHNCF